MELKKCSFCKKDLEATNDNFATKKGKFQSVCRSCQKNYRKKHYEKNKEKYIKKAKKWMDSLRDWFIELKKQLKCEQCGESRYWVLDFHHIDPSKKDLEVSELLNKGNKSKIIDEIAKCKILCSNCHRDLHYQEKQAE